MIKNRIIYSNIILLFVTSFLHAKDISSCMNLKYFNHQCNPYDNKLIRTEEVQYDLDSKRLIISKTLPLPVKKVLKVISVPDIVEKYIKVEDSLRFEAFSTEKLKQPIKNQKQNIIKKELGFYTVLSGDSISVIAQKFNLSTQEILVANHLNKKDTLKIGQKIKIALPQKMIDAISTAKYVIEKGDSILSISYKFNIDAKKLLIFNHLKSSSIIREGKILSLPLPYIIKKKLSLEKKDHIKKKKTSKGQVKIKERKVYFKNKKFGRHRLRVTATAYSSHKGQTDSTPFLAAWNNRLRPGMKIIAVSRDLLSRYGLRNGTRIKISGLSGYYRVRDKMNKRYKKRIDIYMGVNRRKALRWGRRSVVIYW